MQINGQRIACSIEVDETRAAPLPLARAAGQPERNRTEKQHSLLLFRLGDKLPKKGFRAKKRGRHALP